MPRKVIGPQIVNRSLSSKVVNKLTAGVVAAVKRAGRQLAGSQFALLARQERVAQVTFRAAVTDINWWGNPSCNDVWPFSVESRKRRLTIVSSPKVTMLAATLLAPAAGGMGSEREFQIAFL
jgi:hypothetical protein